MNRLARLRSCPLLHPPQPPPNILANKVTGQNAPARIAGPISYETVVGPPTLLARVINPTKKPMIVYTPRKMESFDWNMCV